MLLGTTRSLFEALVLFSLFAAICGDPTTKPPDKVNLVKATNEALPSGLKDSVKIEPDDATTITLNGKLDPLIFAVPNGGKFSLEVFYEEGACFTVSAMCGQFVWKKSDLPLTGTALWYGNSFVVRSKAENESVTLPFDGSEVFMDNKALCQLPRDNLNTSLDQITLRLQTCSNSTKPTKFKVPKATPLMIEKVDNNANGTESTESGSTTLYIAGGCAVLFVIVAAAIVAFVIWRCIKKKKEKENEDNVPVPTQAEGKVSAEADPMATAVAKDPTQKEKKAPSAVSGMAGRGAAECSALNMGEATGARDALPTNAATKQSVAATKQSAKKGGKNTTK